MWSPTSALHFSSCQCVCYQTVNCTLAWMNRFSYKALPCSTSCAPGTMEEPPPDDLDGVVDFIRRSISRLQRTSSTSTTPSLTLPSVTASSSAKNGRRTRRRKNGRKVDKGGGLRPSRVRAVTKVRRGGRPRGRGCALRQVHLNVTDLGLGYYSSEEMIFRYCSGPCRKSETNYDRILQNLAHNGRFSRKDTPARACCRPIAFDDDLSFLDDNLVYHTVRKHSARKCGCV